MFSKTTCPSPISTSLTEEEREQLGRLDIGEIVLFREQEHVRLNVLVLPFEQPLLFTDSST